MTSISVTIPVFNGNKTLNELHERLVAVLEKAADAYEIIFVDDGSTDPSWQTITELALKDPSTRGLRHSRNYGQHNALLTGMRHARYDIIITIDDDLQNPPEEIPILLAKLEEGYDVVYGIPDEERHGFFRDIASRLIKIALQKTMGVKTGRYVSAYRVFKSRLCQAFIDYQHPYIVIDVLLSWATTSFAHVVVKHAKRNSGSSNYSLSKLISHALNMITGFSIFPLQIASYLGFIFTGFGIGVFIYVVGRYLMLGGSVPGFPFLAAIIAIFSGVQLFVLGIIGEYIARIHIRNMNQPLSTIKEKVGYPE